MKKNKNPYIPVILAFCLFSIFFSACKSKKDTPQVVMQQMKQEELFSLVLNHAIQYETFSAKMKSSIRAGKSNFSANATLKIIKDERLLLSFQAPFLGEVFKLGVSADSIIVVDRMNKMYVAESVREIKNMTSFDFTLGNLQSLFTNQLFIPGKSIVDKKDYTVFRFKQDEYNAEFTTTDSRKINYQFTTDFTYHIRQTNIFKDKETFEIEWKYNNFSVLQPTKKEFPMQMEMSMKSGENDLNLNFSFNKIETDQQLTMDFNIPGKYKRVSISQVIHMLNNL